MEIILIILTGTIVSAFFMFAFFLGIKVGKEHKKDDGLVLTEDNKEFVKEMAEWRNYFGGK